MNYTRELESLELLFSKNGYNGDLKSESKVGGYLGSVPVLISAPHSVNHYREGKLKYADMYTGALVMLIQKLTGCYCIFSTGVCEEDPNFILGGSYKNLLENVVKYHNIKYVIDIHGASESRDFDIDLGTLKGQSIDSTIVSDVVNVFKENSILNVKVDDKFPALNPATITSFCCKELGISSVQMEIHKSFRTLSETGNITKLVSSLSSVVKYLSEDSLVESR
jgi:hypothetical protein